MALPDGYEISSDLRRIDFEKVHSWLTTAYWSTGVSKERIEKSASNSTLVLGAYYHGQQVGFLRVVSDKTTFAWLCDVWVDEGHRGKGLAKAMVRTALTDPEHMGMKRWLLATSNAHPIYVECGFEILPSPERWMMYLP